ncbi:helix-turn-helix transcriptional regulator [Flavobacterium columnare]|uniref:helix-turn-helix domain-containing protein n=1 Tax=Flavobacterium columnare TaxID=996 RepID=UPI002989BE3B|nr:helix-turn-helix transcriptional regulator [Flavobacterium columnare]MCH4831140.1 helix-turn-helix transcriptional regulator [Flavobacterium columnare]
MILLGDRIKKIREEKGLSQKEVASKVDIDRGQYSRIETNKVEPTYNIRKNCNCFWSRNRRFNKKR